MASTIAPFGEPHAIMRFLLFFFPWVFIMGNWVQACWIFLYFSRRLFAFVIAIVGSSVVMPYWLCS